MDIVRGLIIPQGFQGRKAVIALGNFDGIHRGHQALIREAVRRAGENGAYSAALILDPHPSQVLFPERAPHLIISQDFQSRLLEAEGLDVLYYYPFTPELAQYSPRAFVEQILVRDLQVGEVIVGFNYSFGHKGAGKPETLLELGREYGFSVSVVDPVCRDGEVVSSSLIRRCLDQGDVISARELLGYYPLLEGFVVEGEKRGAAIGVPTANLGVAPIYNIPAYGVYSAFAVIEDDRTFYRSVVNIGIKPTFHESFPISVEAHLLDFEGNIYGRRMRIYLVERLRDEQKFNGIEELVAQIGRDREEARQSLAQAREPEYQ